MGFTSSRQKHGQKVFPKYKKRICTTVTSHVNSSRREGKDMVKRWPQSNLSGTSRSDSGRDERASARKRRCQMSNAIVFFNFSSRRIDIFPDLFGRPIRTSIHTYVNVIGPNYEVAPSHFFNLSAKQRREGERWQEKGIGGRCRPSAVPPERGGWYEGYGNLKLTPPA